MSSTFLTWNNLSLLPQYAYCVGTGSTIVAPNAASLVGFVRSGGESLFSSKISLHSTFNTRIIIDESGIYSFTYNDDIGLDGGAGETSFVVTLLKNSIAVSSHFNQALSITPPYQTRLNPSITIMLSIVAGDIISLSYANDVGSGSSIECFNTSLVITKVIAT